MKKKPATRPAILIRLHKDDLARLRLAAEQACTPCEAFARRAILERVAQRLNPQALTHPAIADAG